MKIPYAILMVALLVFPAWAGLPEGAEGFAGMIRGVVKEKGADGKIIVSITAMEKSWKHSTAAVPGNLKSEEVVLEIDPAQYKRGEALAKARKFFESLEVGDDELFDVRDSSKGSLLFLEVTKEQAERIGD